MQALKRIIKELADYQNKYKETPNKFIKTLGPVDDCDMFKWEATIYGPKNSPYKQHIFNLLIEIPRDYPFKPPIIKFEQKIFHVNIHSGGVKPKICCESFPYIYTEWSPALTIEKVLMMFIELLEKPDFESCNLYGYNENLRRRCYFERDYDFYYKTAKEWTEKYAEKGSFEEDNEKRKNQLKQNKINKKQEEIKENICNNSYIDSDFSNLKLISNGFYADIFFAYSIKDQIEICLKKINIEKMKLNYQKNEITDYMKDLNNEIAILKLLSNNKNSVKYYGSYDNNNEKIIVMEKCDLNLLEYMKKRGASLDIKEIRDKFLELNELFKLLQKEHIIHRDLKLENFLIKYTDKDNYILKLGDYGIGKFKNLSNHIFSGIKGTEDTIAPEIILEKEKNYNDTVDIFSLGIILYQLSNNLKHPFGKNYLEYGMRYQTNYEEDNLIIDFDDSMNDDNLRDLIIKMTKINPRNRLKWDNYFTHPFFNS